MKGRGATISNRKDARLQQLALELEPRRTGAEVLQLLRSAGAKRLVRVTFRANRSTIWSLTRGGRALNLHEAYRTAPVSVLRAFGVVASRANRPDGSYRNACRAVREWPGLDYALHRQRDVSKDVDVQRRSTPCKGTVEERARMRALYDRLNETRFRGRLPTDIPLRISRRMKTRLGHMAPAGNTGAPAVGEIALNRALFLTGNEAVLSETLLHEMAHVAAYLFDGHAGHGPPWRRWAMEAGCHPGPCIALPLRSGRD